MLLPQMPFHPYDKRSFQIKLLVMSLQPPVGLQWPSVTRVSLNNRSFETKRGGIEGEE